MHGLHVRDAPATDHDLIVERQVEMTTMLCGSLMNAKAKRTETKALKIYVTRTGMTATTNEPKVH
jgi:hypothetical protein